MGFFDREEPEQQVMDLMTVPPQALLALYGLINQGASNVSKNVGLLGNPPALKERLLSPVPNYWGNLFNPENRNQATDMAMEHALNFGPMPIGSLESAIAKGIQVKNTPDFSKLENRLLREKPPIDPMPRSSKTLEQIISDMPLEEKFRMLRRFDIFNAWNGR